MNTVEIVSMTKNDIPQVADIVVNTFSKAPLNESLNVKNMVKHLSEEFSAEYSFVAKENDVIIGALVGNVYPGDEKPTYHIDMLVVEETKRDHGIGDQLFSKAQETAKFHNIHLLDLDANPKLRSFNWYKRLGFSESGWVDLEKTI